jgi:hypothetical protein
MTQVSFVIVEGRLPSKVEVEVSVSESPEMVSMPCGILRLMTGLVRFVYVFHIFCDRRRPFSLSDPMRQVHL